MNENIQIQQAGSCLLDGAGERQNHLFSVLELFPIPLKVFAADGTSLFVNQAFADSFHIDAQQLAGKFNVLQGPI